MKGSLFIISAVCASTGLAQPTFQKYYTTSFSLNFSCNELASNHLLAGLGCGHGVSIIDGAGDILYTQCYLPDPMVRIAAVKQSAANEFVFATGYLGDQCETASGSVRALRPAIGRMDSLGSILDYKYYEMAQGCRNIPGDVLPTADGGAITWGSDTSFFALRVDEELAPVWAKRVARKGGFQFIKELPSGDLLAGLNMETAGAVLARMGPNGDIIWSKSYIRPRGVVHDVLIESDDSFIITGYTDSTSSTDPSVPYPSTFQPKLFLLKVNGVGDVQWCRGYSAQSQRWYTPQSSRIKRSLGGNYTVLATIGYPQNNFFHRPFLMKTTSDGDTLWTRKVGAAGYDYYSKDLLALIDGGYVISGGVWGDFAEYSSAAYLFKSDASANFSCWDAAYPVQLQELFPIDSSFTLIATDGALGQSANMVNATFPISSYDACTFITGAPMRARSNPRPKVTPNPTPGRFTVEFQDPLMKDSYYSVYDAMGKLLFQRAAAHGKKTEEVDLTGYGKGTYVIRFTDPDGVCFERVMLE